MQLVWSLFQLSISTCFGHHYVHLQENKTVYYLLWCSALVVLAVVVWSWDASCDTAVHQMHVSLKSHSSNGYLTWRPVCIYDNNFLRSSYDGKCFRLNVVKEIKTHLLWSITCFRKSYRLWDNVEKYNRPGGARDDIRRVHISRWVPKSINTHTFGIYNTYRFSTATIVARTRLNVTLHINCLYCWIYIIITT